jgi:citrate lyase beta subunit
MWMERSGFLPTMLFVPGSDRRKLEKIPTLPAAGFILDLEDAVAVTAKAAAREQVGAFITEHGATSCLYVRVNGFETDLLYDDLHAVTVPGLTGIDIPKVTSGKQLQIVDWLLGILEKQRGIQPGSVVIMATIETVQGLWHIDEIATATPRLRRLCFGAGDFSLDIGVTWPPSSGHPSASVINAKVTLVLASRQFGLEPPHDGVFPDFRDLAGLRAEAEQSKGLGMDGKHAIHPDQLPVIAEVFTPSESEIARARDIVAQFEHSERDGVAAIHIDGHFIDYPVAARARQILQRAEERRSGGLREEGS